MKTKTTNPDAVATTQLSELTIDFWCSFVLSQCATRPAAANAHVWEAWSNKTGAPPYRVWYKWCRDMGIPFETLLVKLGSTWGSDGLARWKNTELSKWRSDTLRKLYGRIPHNFYPLLDAMLSNTIEATAEEVSPDRGFDLRENAGQLDELRKAKWAKLLIKHRSRLATLKTPEFVPGRIRKEDWARIISGETYPKVDLAGMVGDHLGIEYDEFFEVYRFEELTGGITTDRLYHTMASLRSKFNKTWPDENPGFLQFRADARSRRAAGRQAAIETRRASLLRYYVEVAERCARLTESGDVVKAALAKVEFDHVEASLIDQKIPFVPVTPPLEAPTTPKREEIDPATGISGPVEGRRARLKHERGTPNPAFADLAVEDGVLPASPEPQPTPPPPPPPAPPAAPPEQPALPASKPAPKNQQNRPVTLHQFAVAFKPTDPLARPVHPAPAAPTPPPTPPPAPPEPPQPKTNFDPAVWPPVPAPAPIVINADAILSI